MLSFTDKHRLADALAAVPALTSTDSRQQALELLPPYLRSAVRTYPTPGHDLFGLVRTTLEYPNGFTDLLRVLQVVEGDSLALDNVREIAAALGLLPTVERS